ncbi:MAG: hypothetical protein DRP76_00345 [Candidatus Omnitrophota bacterium]|nr:MAG: hypothetical protein DRP76_00345 [Candidatus Omnitrophota bacterium]
MTFLEIIKRIICAFVLGAVIGLEREKKRRSAGLRTHILVCMGSSLVMLVSLYMYELFRDKVPLDPARIAAGVITGIGFLGAGTIIRSQEGIRGLTTAASIWISSAIGLAVGCGFYEAGLIVTLLAFLTLSSLKTIEKKF